MLRRTWVILLVLGLAWNIGARADSINVVGTTGSFQSFPGTFNTVGTPYWNGQSWDSVNGKSDGKANIGHYLTGTGDFVGGFMDSPQIPTGDLQQFVNGDGTSADQNIKFTTPAVNVTAQLYITIAGNAATNKFGWYDVDGQHELFSGSDSAFFTPNGAFGLYMETASHGTFYTESSLNTDSSGQHFALFKQSNGKLWIGIEDLPLNSSDRDYNDLVLSLEAIDGSNIPTPEPASLLTFCLGGLVLGGYRLRRRLQAH